MNIDNELLNLGPQGFQGASSPSFNFRFRIKYETKFGEKLCVIGSSKELGNWKHFLDLKWTEGHVWYSDLISTRIPLFQYKYVLMTHDKQVWERGINRIANLATYSQEVLNDAWERFKLVFQTEDP